MCRCHFLCVVANDVSCNQVELAAIKLCKSWGLQKNRVPRMMDYYHKHKNRTFCPLVRSFDFLLYRPTG